MDTKDDQHENSTPSPRNHKLRGIIIAVALAALVWLLWKGLSTSTPSKPSTPPVPVRTTLVKQQTVPITRTGVGYVVPIMSVTVHTRVDGQLDSVAFREGQDVKAHQLLAQIDPRTYKAQFDQAVAQKARDAAALENARVDLARYEELIKADATTQQTLATQRALVRQLLAAVQNDDAQVEFARVNLGYTTITAPIAGRIGAQLINTGNIVHAADTNGMLVINQLDPIAVQFTLPEADFQLVNAALHAGKSPLTVQAVERSTHEILGTGQLAVLNNQIDTTTGTIMLKAYFPNPQHKLWPGQSIDGRILLGQRANAITVAAPVMQRGPDGMFVYVVDADDKAQVQPIQIDADDSDVNIVVVTQGLSVGQRVVLDGQYRLTPNARIVESQPSAPTPPPRAGAGGKNQGGGKGTAQ